MTEPPRRPYSLILKDDFGVSVEAKVGKKKGTGNTRNEKIGYEFYLTAFWRVVLRILEPHLVSPMFALGLEGRELVLAICHSYLWDGW